MAYDCADIVIMPSKFEEPFGMVALEALASGKIVIASKRGGMIEFLDNKNSIIIEDYENFAPKAKEIILNLTKNQIDDIKQNALHTAKEFDWINIAINTERLYNELL